MSEPFEKVEEFPKAPHADFWKDYRPTEAELYEQWRARFGLKPAPLSLEINGAVVSGWEAGPFG